MVKNLVSIVLPIYNVERYLNRCMDSIVNQSYQNLEIIMVDDGSTDHSPQICDVWKSKDKRVKVIHKQNAGLGMARNTGIDNANGEYICFFDSDDYIAPDTIEKTYSLAKKLQAEITLFGFSQINSKGGVEKLVIPATDKELYIGSEVQEELLPNLIAPDTSTGKQTNLHMSAWAALYSLPLLKHTAWYFTSERDIIAEDVYSLLQLYKYVNRAAVCPLALYYYCENENSLTHTYRKDRYEKIKHFYDACLQVCEELGYGTETKERLKYPYLSFTIAALKMIAVADSSKAEKAKNIQDIICDSHLQNVICNVDIKREKLYRKIIILAMKSQLSDLVYIFLKLGHLF